MSQRLLESSILISVLSVGVSLMGFLNQLVIARIFGTTPQLEAYLVGVSLPTLAMGMISGLCSYSLIPILVLPGSSAAERAQFRGMLLLCCIGAGALLWLVGYLLTPVLVRALAPALADPFRTEAVTISRIGWGSAACSVVLSYLAAVHNASRRFLTPLLASGLPYAAMMLTVSLAYMTLGVIALSWGLLIGEIAGIVLLGAGVARNLTVSNEFLLYRKEIGSLFARMPIVLVSMLCFTAYSVIDAYWAMRLEPGNLAHLGYSHRLLVALSNIVTLGPATVLLPHLAGLNARGDRADFLRICGKALRAVLVTAAPLALLLSVFSRPVVELIFERGEFRQEATAGVASILPAMLLGAIPMFGVVVLFKALYAEGGVFKAALIGALGTGSYFAMSGVLSRVFGLQGIAASYAFTWWLVLGISIAAIWGNAESSLFRTPQLLFALRLVGALLVCGTCAIIAKRLWIRPMAEIGRIGLLLQLAAASVVSLCGFLITAGGILKMPEARMLLEIDPLRRLGWLTRAPAPDGVSQ